jgi:Uma2 family endonuclease
MTVGRIFILLENHNRQLKLGRVMTNETGIVVKRDPDTVRGADVLFISYRRMPESEDWDGFIRHPPELVVEVLARDDSWKRMEEKVADYHAFGIDLVWVADPQTLAVRVYPKGEPSSVLQGTDEITGRSAFPELRCNVSDFFA